MACAKSWSGHRHSQNLKKIKISPDWWTDRQTDWTTDRPTNWPTERQSDILVITYEKFMWPWVHLNIFWSSLTKVNSPSNTHGFNLAMTQILDVNSFMIWRTFEAIKHSNCDSFKALNLLVIEKGPTGNKFCDFIIIDPPPISRVLNHNMINLVKASYSGAGPSSGN